MKKKELECRVERFEQRMVELEVQLTMLFRMFQGFVDEVKKKNKIIVK